MSSGGITFSARKRRAVEPLESKVPSDRIARKKMFASLGAKLAIAPPYAAASPHHAAHRQTAGKGESEKRAREHRNRLQHQEEEKEDSLFLASPSVVDGLHSNRRLQAFGHAIEGAGNSLLALRESSTEAVRDTWRVEATSFEMHTPKLVRRQVRTRRLALSCKQCTQTPTHTSTLARALSRVYPPALYGRRVCMWAHLFAYCCE